MKQNGRNTLKTATAAFILLLNVITRKFFSLTKVSEMLALWSLDHPPMWLVK
jgi:hypothetical protein